MQPAAEQFEVVGDDDAPPTTTKGRPTGRPRTRDDADRDCAADRAAASVPPWSGSGCGAAGRAARRGRGHRFPCARKNAASVATSRRAVEVVASARRWRRMRGARRCTGGAAASRGRASRPARARRRRGARAPRAGRQPRMPQTTTPPPNVSSRACTFSIPAPCQRRAGRTADSPGRGRRRSRAGSGRHPPARPKARPQRREGNAHVALPGRPRDEPGGTANSSIATVPPGRTTRAASHRRCGIRDVTEQVGER